jgi:hypothetical protein
MRQESALVRETISPSRDLSTQYCNSNFHNHIACPLFPGVWFSLPFVPPLPSFAACTLREYLKIS